MDTATALTWTIVTFAIIAGAAIILWYYDKRFKIEIPTDSNIIARKHTALFIGSLNCGNNQCPKTKILLNTKHSPL